MPNKKYKLPAKFKEKTTTVSEDQLSSGVTGNIRNAILNVNKNAYDKYFEYIKKAENAENEKEKDTVPLNSSFGSENAKKGRVVSFNVAGSSYAQPIRYNKGLAGKSNVWLYDHTTGRKVYLKKGEEYHLYSFKNQDNTITTLRGVGEVNAHAEKVVKDVFGNSGVLGKKEIRVKESADKRKYKYTISGPRTTFINYDKKEKKVSISSDSGILNAGDYKIEKTSQYISDIGEEYLEKLAYDRDFIRSGEHVHFTFTGHSRGGCGVIEGAMKLKYILKTKYPGLADRVHFDALLYDPVPGPKTRIQSNINQGINLREQTREMAAEKMMPFDDNDHCTVLYSIGCNHQVGFTPMKVMGADTIILTGHSHDEGLKDVEDQYGIKRRAAYINSENGQAYRSSGLAGMPKGLYISDENNVLIKADSMRMVEKVINEVYTRPDKPKNARIRRITEAGTDLMVRNGGRPTLDTIVRGFNAHDPFYVHSSPEFRAMKEQFRELDRLMHLEERDPEKIIEERLKLRQMALDYINTKNGKGPHSNRTHGRLDVAKNIVRYIDARNEFNMNWITHTKLEESEKLTDIREAYVASISVGLQQNMEFMEQLCTDYKHGKTVETDMFKQTLASMMAARYFQKHSDYFMPQPITDPKDDPAEQKKFDILLGEGKDSLYEVFGSSEAVNKFANRMLRGEVELSKFSNPEQIIETLDKLAQRVKLEYTAKLEKSAPAAKKEAVIAPVKEEPVKAEQGKEIPVGQDKVLK